MLRSAIWSIKTGAEIAVPPAVSAAVPPAPRISPAVSAAVSAAVLGNPGLGAL